MKRGNLYIGHIGAKQARQTHSPDPYMGGGMRYLLHTILALASPKFRLVYIRQGELASE